MKNTLKNQLCSRILHSDEIRNSENVLNLEYLKHFNFEREINYCTNVFDFRNTFDGMDETHIYFDVGHMSDFGNEVVAEKIFEKILPIVIQDIQG